MTVGLRRKRFINWCVGYGVVPIWSYVGMRIPWNTFYAGFVGFPVGLTTFCYIWFLLYLAFLVYFLDEPYEEDVETYDRKVRVGQYLLVKHGLMNRREYPKFMRWNREYERRIKREKMARRKRYEKERKAKQRKEEAFKLKKEKEKELRHRAVEDKQKEEEEIKEAEKKLEEEEAKRIKETEEKLHKEGEEKERKKKKEEEKEERKRKKEEEEAARREERRRKREERKRQTELAKKYPGVDPEGDEGQSMV